MNNIIRHGKLSGIYNEPMGLKEFFQIAFFFGLPFSAAFALIYSLLK